MIVTATEFKTNLGKYLELLDGLVDVIPTNAMNANTAREERLSRQ